MAVTEDGGRSLEQHRPRAADRRMSLFRPAAHQPIRLRRWSRWRPSSTSCSRADAIVVDAHTHLGRDEDGQSQDSRAAAGVPGPGPARCSGVHFPFTIPSARPPTVAHDRVLALGAGIGRTAVSVLPAGPGRGSGGRGRALPGARSPRDQAAPTGPGVRVRHAAAESIWKIADEAKVPILIHAGAGCRGWTRSPTSRCAFPTSCWYSPMPRLPTRACSPPGCATTPGPLRHLDVLRVRPAQAVRPGPSRADRVRLRRPLRAPISALHIILLMAGYAGLDGASARAHRRDDARRARGPAAGHPEPAGTGDPPGQRSAWSGSTAT